MAIQSPYVTERFTASVADVITSRLTFAILLIDAFTLEGPAGGVKVKLKDSGHGVTKNLSGYYFFTDMAPGIYTVRAEGEFYDPAEQTVDTSLLDARHPVVQIVLRPNPRYPFPAAATLLRGVVVNAAPVEGADISVTGKPMTTVTGNGGEFVLFFRGIKTETITIVIRKGGDTKSVGATIEEGKTVSAGRIHFP